MDYFTQYLYIFVYQRVTLLAEQHAHVELHYVESSSCVRHIKCAIRVVHIGVAYIE